MKQTIILMIAVFILTMAAGCTNKNVVTPPGDNKPVSKSVKLIEPEELISQQEAEKILGQPVNNGEKNENKAVGMRLCIYNSVKESRFLQISLTQQALMPANGQSPKSIFLSLKNNFPNAVKVEDIGDDAFIAPPGMHILKNDYYISLAVGNSKDAKNQEILKTAGKTAVANLEKVLYK